MPTAWIQPAFSCPRTSGSSDGMTPANQPSMICRSVRHSPAPPILTTTSSGPATWGSGTSSSCGGCPYECTRIAFMDSPCPADVVSQRSSACDGPVRCAGRGPSEPAPRWPTRPARARGPARAPPDGAALQAGGRGFSARSNTPRPRAARVQMNCARCGTGPDSTAPDSKDTRYKP